MKQITAKQLDQLILREAEKKTQDPMAAQREQAEEQKFELIKKLQELGEKIHGQINNSFEHLNAFMNLGTKTRDTFEYERAVAEIGRIQKLTGNMAHLIKKAHETATTEPAVQESPYDSRKMSQMANPKPIIGPRQQKPSPVGMGMQETKYGVIMESYGQFKTVDVFAKSAAEALLKVRKTNPAWEVKRIVILEAAPVKGSKPPLFPDSKSSDQKPAKPSSKEPPVKEPASGSEVPPWFKGAYDESNDNVMTINGRPVKYTKPTLSPEIQAFVATLEKKYGHDFISKATPQERAQYMVLAKKAGSGSLADPSSKQERK